MATNSLTTDQLRRALDIKEQIESLEAELSQVLGAIAPIASTGAGRGRGKRPAAAQRARWAKLKPAKAARKKMSAAARARMAAAARARWKKAKSAGKKSLATEPSG